MRTGLRDLILRAWAVVGLGISLGSGASWNLLGQPLPAAGRGAVVPARSPAPVPLGLPAGGFVVDLSRREESRAFFNTVFQASENVAMGWTGSYATGDAGTTALGFRQATILRVNYFRAMAGVPANVVLNEEFSRKSQQAALIMSANRILTHNPTADLLFFSADGAEAAANSNLSIGRAGPDAAFGQMADDGASNFAVGHRRWILHPQTRQMGSGDVPGDATRLAANSLWVFDANTFGSRPATRTEYVAWPPPGYVPYGLIFSRWSFGYPNALFANATVTMTRHGTNVPVRLEPLQGGFSDNTLVWVPDNLDTSAPSAPARPAADTAHRVTVANVVIGGQTRQFTYEVIVFNPEVEGPDTRVPAVTGPSQIGVGAAAGFAVEPVPLTSAYQWRLGSRAAYTLVEGAENGLANMQASTTGTYDPVARDIRAAGQASFHLACPDFRNQFLVLNRNIIPGAASQLRFRSQLGFATETQAALVQVSVDEGGSWRTLYRQVGSRTSPEFSFRERTVDLGAFAGRVIRLRFAYWFEGGLAILDTSAGSGWYFDEISVTGAEEFVPLTSGDAGGGGAFAVTAAAPGNYGLQARGKVFGSYFLDWGPVKPVQAADLPPAPRFLGLERVGAGGLELVLSVRSGASYRIETSTDLAVWGTLTTVTASGTNLRVPDPAGFGATRKFYRARVLP